MGDAIKGPFTCRNDTEKTEANRLLPHEEKSQWKSNILKRCLYDPFHRRKVLYSVWISLIYLCLGLVIGQNGPTLLDLQIITNTDLVAASYLLTGYFVGYLVGCFLCGVIFDRVDKNLYMVTGLLLVGVLSIITPYCFSLATMILVRTIIGIFLGLIHAGGITEQMRVWGKEGSELIQMLQFCFALGGVLSPLYSEPFLAETTAENFTSPSLTNYTDPSSVISETQGTTTDVRYAFIITGFLCFISGIPWFILFLQGKFGSRRDIIRSDVVVTQRKLPTHVLLYMIFMLSLIYLFFMTFQVGVFSFLTTFVVSEFNESKSKGALLTSVFCAIYAASRLVMIFTSQLLTPVELLCMSCIIAILASICFAISAMFSALDALAIFTAVFGLSISGVFPAGFSWAESDLMKVTSRVSASIMLASSVGAVISSILNGFLMYSVSNMWFCYLLIIEAIAMFTAFLTLFVTSKFFINRRYIFEYETLITGETKVSIN